MMLKMVALAPIPSPSDRAATIVKAGFFRSIRSPYSMSCHSVIKFHLRVRLMRDGHANPAVDRQTEKDLKSSGRRDDFPAISNYRKQESWLLSVCGINGSPGSGQRQLDGTRRARYTILDCQAQVTLPIPHDHQPLDGV